MYSLKLKTKTMEYINKIILSDVVLSFNNFSANNEDKK